MKAEEVTRLCVVQVLEGRRLFQHLTTEKKLCTGAMINPNQGEVKQFLEQVSEYFPPLRNLRQRTAGYISGGAQQMVAIGRAFMAKPRLMLLDEPSLGLAPLLIQDIFEIIQRINSESGTSMLIVEQNANVALQVADYAYVNGKRPYCSRWSR